MTWHSKNAWELKSNPLNGNILYYTADESLTVKVFDILGKEVFSRQKAADDNHIDVSNLKAGVYIVQFTSPSTGAKVIKKLIKQFQRVYISSKSITTVSDAGLDWQPKIKPSSTSASERE